MNVTHKVGLSSDRQRYDVVHLRRLGAAGLSEVWEESWRSLEYGTFQTANEVGMSNQPSVCEPEAALGSLRNMHSAACRNFVSGTAS